MKRNRRQRKKGMSLIEILIVVAIMATMMGVLATQLGGSREGANIKLAKVGMGQIKGAIDRFELDINRIPTSEEGLKILVSASGLNGWHGPYVEQKQLNDPWNVPYEYEFVSRKEFRIVSAGPDGQIGNEDDISYPDDKPEGTESTESKN